ncbi:MAG: hypothetical protein AB9900_03075 [Humidesulfovibrio sp.]
MGGNKGQATSFSMVVRADEVRVRKPLAPPARPMADRRRKDPRRRPDLLAECRQPDE